MPTPPAQPIGSVDQRLCSRTVRRLARGGRSPAASAVARTRREVPGCGWKRLPMPMRGAGLCPATAPPRLTSGSSTAAHLVGRPLPAWPWLSQGGCGASVPALPMPPVESAAFTAALEQPLLRRLCPAPIAARLLTLARTPDLLRHAGWLSQTFCDHNVLAAQPVLREGIDEHASTVLIDSAMPGWGHRAGPGGVFLPPSSSKRLRVTALPASRSSPGRGLLAGLQGWGGAVGPRLARPGIHGSGEAGLRGSVCWGAFVRRSFPRRDRRDPGQHGRSPRGVHRWVPES